MKKMISKLLGLLMIIAGLLSAGLTKEALARVNVEVEVNLGAPVFEEDEPAEVVFAPGFGFYFVPNVEYEVFFYNGFWWSRRGPHWYRSRYYRNGWGIVGNREVPGRLFKTPRNYRERFRHERRIRYWDWNERPNQNSEKGGGNMQQGGVFGRPHNVEKGGGQSVQKSGGQSRSQNVQRNREKNKEKGGNRRKGRQNEDQGEGERRRN